MSIVWLEKCSNKKSIKFFIGLECVQWNHIIPVTNWPQKLEHINRVDVLKGFLK